MLLPSIRRLALADVDGETLRLLVDEGESLYVERKREPPEAPKFGAAAASFANMLGGFVLLGIEDDGQVVGWEPPGRADMQSYIGELLRQQVDPLPPYVADRRELDGKKVGVIRVFESVDSPHVVRGTGAIYVRSSKGKDPVPVDDHRTVLEMARRGTEALVEAGTRLMRTPDVMRIFGLPDSTSLSSREQDGAQVISRATPLTVTPALSDWALTRDAADRCSRLAAELLPTTNYMGLSMKQLPERFTFGRSIAAKVTRVHPFAENDESMVMVDSAGVAVAALRRRPDNDEPPHLELDRMLEDELLPLATAVVDLLVGGEGYGRAIIDVWVLVGDDEIVMTQGSWLVEGQVHVSRELTIPGDEDETRELAEGWYREILREAGRERFEGEPHEEEPTP